MKPYPLQFKPEMKERIWGGRALAQFGFDLPEGPIGEAWLIGDHPNGTTRVANGPLQGLGLDQVRESYGELFFGTKGFSQKNGRFPLLIKLLDCQDDLSVQVHPNDDYAGLPEGELGKTEMWYVLAAKPDAKIIYGLKENIDRPTLAALIESGQVIDGLQEVSVQAGDSFYIPAGTVHALGSGVLVAEVQQNSDTVFRLYDYNRPGLDGLPRELHIEDSLNVIDYKNTGASRMTTHMTAANEWLTLASSPFFVVEKGRVHKDVEWQLASHHDTFSIIMVCDGEGILSWGNDAASSGEGSQSADAASSGEGSQSADAASSGEGLQDADATSLSEAMHVKAGDCFLLPANLGDYALRGEMTVLRSYLPGIEVLDLVL